MNEHALSFSKLGWKCKDNKPPAMDAMPVKFYMNIYGVICGCLFSDGAIMKDNIDLSGFWPHIKKEDR